MPDVKDAASAIGAVVGGAVQAANPVGGLGETIGGLLQGASALIGRFKETPDLKAEQAFTLQMAQMQVDQAIKLANIQAASAAITAEATSTDPVVKRARPYFLYICYCVFGFNFIVLPLLLMCLAVAGLINHTLPWSQITSVVKPIDLPAWFYQVFIAGYLGYTTARSFDKQQALPGDSSIKLPFGISVGNGGNGKR